MARPSKRELHADEDMGEALIILQAIIEAKGDYKDDFVDWAIGAVERIREHYGQ